MTLSKTKLDGTSDVEIMSFIQKALDEKIIIFETGNKMAYVFTPLNKELVRIKVSERDERIFKLKSYFDKNPEDWQMLMDELGIEPIQTLTVDKVLETTHVMRLKSYCNDLGLEYAITDKKVELQEKIIEKLKNME